MDRIAPIKLPTSFRTQKRKRRRDIGFAYWRIVQPIETLKRHATGGQIGGILLIARAFGHNGRGATSAKSIDKGLDKCER